MLTMLVRRCYCDNWVEKDSLGWDGMRREGENQTNVQGSIFYVLALACKDLQGR